MNNSYENLVYLLQSDEYVTGYNRLSGFGQTLVAIHSNDSSTKENINNNGFNIVYFGTDGDGFIVVKI